MFSALLPPSRRHFTPSFPSFSYRCLKLRSWCYVLEQDILVWVGNSWAMSLRRTQQEGVEVSGNDPNCSVSPPADLWNFVLPDVLWPLAPRLLPRNPLGSFLYCECSKPSASHCVQPFGWSAIFQPYPCLEIVGSWVLKGFLVFLLSINSITFHMKYYMTI